jgi:uncharacterized membrane protein YeaQ/YmgE (transglycosylase-associated protein family)
MRKPDVAPTVQISLPAVTIAACLTGIIGALVALAIFRLTSVPL